MTLTVTVAVQKLLRVPTGQEKRGKQGKVRKSENLGKNLGKFGCSTCHQNLGSNK